MFSILKCFQQFFFSVSITAAMWLRFQLIFQSVVEDQKMLLKELVGKSFKVSQVFFFFNCKDKL